MFNIKMYVKMQIHKKVYTKKHKVLEKSGKFQRILGILENSRKFQTFLKICSKFQKILKTENNCFLIFQVSKTLTQGAKNVPNIKKNSLRKFKKRKSCQNSKGTSSPIWNYYFRFNITAYYQNNNLSFKKIIAPRSQPKKIVFFHQK